MNRYDTNKPFFIIPWVIADDEIFVDITDIAVPGIYPYYMISNYGRVFNKYNKYHPFTRYNLDSRGYWHSPVQTKYGQKLIRNHRMEMIMFNWVAGCDNLVVDHIDGNKLNMKLSNLQWLTMQNNSLKGFAQFREYGGIPAQVIPDYIKKDIELQEQYAISFKSNMIKPFSITTYTQKNFNDLKSEYNCQSSSDNIHAEKTKHTTEEKIKICEMLQQGYTQSYIATTLHVKKSYVSSILHKQTATEISDNYDFSNYGTIPYHDKWMFTPDQVHAICKYLQEYSIDTYNSRKTFIKQMFATLGIEYTDQRYRTVLDIYKGRGYTSVSSQYKFK